MKKTSFLLALIVLIVVNSCQKELPSSPTSKVKNTSKSIAEDKSISISVLSIIEDHNLNSAEKANQILNLGELIPSDLKLINNNKSIFDPTHLELIFASQFYIEDAVLVELLKDKKIPDNVIFNVLATRYGSFSPIVKKSLLMYRSNINQNRLNYYVGLDKMLCLCKNTIVFAEEIIDVMNGEELTVIISDPIYLPISAGAGDVEILASGCGKGWTCGEYTEVIKKSEDIIQVIGKCTRPPIFQKCVKIIKPNPENLMNPGYDNRIFSQNPNDLSLTKKLIENEPVDNDVIEQILRNHDRFSEFSLELILLTSKKLNASNLKRLSAIQRLNDRVIENVLIVNSPLDNHLSEIIKEFRPNIDFTLIQSVRDKEVVISLCANAMLIGNQIEISEISSQNHEIVIENLIKRSFGGSDNNELINQISEGCGRRWICGDLVLFSESETQTKFRCVAPPNNKCALKAKEVKK